MIGETVVVHRHTAGATDAHGNPVLTYTDVEVSGVSVSPRAGEEQGDNRDAVIIGLTVYMPAGTDVSPQDEMTVRDIRYEVVGEPGVWTSPFSGRTAGVQVALERVEG